MACVQCIVNVTVLMFLPDYFSSTSERLLCFVTCPYEQRCMLTLMSNYWSGWWWWSAFSGSNSELDCKFVRTDSRTNLMLIVAWVLSVCLYVPGLRLQIFPWREKTLSKRKFAGRKQEVTVRTSTRKKQMLWFSFEKARKVPLNILLCIFFIDFLSLDTLTTF